MHPSTVHAALTTVTTLLALTAVLASSSTSFAGDNGNITLGMHAVDTSFGICGIPDPCSEPGGAVVNAEGFTQLAAYLFARHHGNLAAVQTAFDFGGMVFTFGLWDCQSNQVNGAVPSPPGGSTDGTIATAFDCIAGGETAIIGRLHLLPLAGCLTQADSSFPFGTHVVDCSGATDAVDALRRGSICVGGGGVSVCTPPVPVEPTTWGAIKSGYRER